MMELHATLLSSLEKCKVQYNTILWTVLLNIRDDNSSSIEEDISYRKVLPFIGFRIHTRR